jgi:hypothetical protein
LTALAITRLPFLSEGQGIRQESIVTGSKQIAIPELFLKPHYDFRG